MDTNMNVLKQIGWLDTHGFIGILDLNHISLRTGIVSLNLSPIAVSFRLAY